MAQIENCKQRRCLLSVLPGWRAEEQQQQLERDIFTSSRLSPPYLFYDGPPVLPLLETVACHGVDSLRVARIKLSHLLIQEALKRQLLIFILDVVLGLHLAEGGRGREKSHLRWPAAVIKALTRGKYIRIQISFIALYMPGWTWLGPTGHVLYSLITAKNF